MAEKAMIFIGFRHKKGAVLCAKVNGFKTVLLTSRASEKAAGLFDEIFEEDLTDDAKLRPLVHRISQKYSVKGVISNYEHYVVLRSYLAQMLGLPSAGIYGAACSRNKALQRQALALLPQNVPHRMVKSEAEALKAFDELGSDVFLKFIAGIKSKLIFRLKSREEVAPCFRLLQSQVMSMNEDLRGDYKSLRLGFEYPDPTSTFLMEKAIQGMQVTVSSLANGKDIWHAPSICDVYRASDLGRDDSFLAFRILPSRLPQETVQKISRISEEAARILDLKHCSLFSDIIIDPSGTAWLIEIASRMGGYRPQMYRAAYDLDMDQLLIRSVLGETLEASPPARCHVSMMEIFPEEEGVFESMDNLDLLEKDTSVQNKVMTAKKGDRVGLARDGFQPCLRFMIRGESYDEVYKKSLDYQRRLKVRLTPPSPPPPEPALPKQHPLF